MDKPDKQGRGALTDRVKKKSIELLGYEIGLREFRLMPYIQYRLMNEHKLARAHVNAEERVILEKWEKAGYMKREAWFWVEVSKEFWDIMSELLYLGYVDIDKYS